MKSEWLSRSRRCSMLARSETRPPWGWGRGERPWLAEAFGEPAPRKRSARLLAIGVRQNGNAAMSGGEGADGSSSIWSSALRPMIRSLHQTD
jgi:hypothetical protein